MIQRAGTMREFLIRQKAEQWNSLLDSLILAQTFVISMT